MARPVGVSICQRVTKMSCWLVIAAILLTETVPTTTCNPFPLDPATGRPINNSRAPPAKQSMTKRQARWTFRVLQDDMPINGTEGLQYDPITEVIDLPIKPPVSLHYPPDKYITPEKDATVIMNEISSLKKGFCKTEKLTQRIKVDGCQGKNIVNRYCYGQCNTFYIPEGPKSSRDVGTRKGNRARNATGEYLEDEDLTVPALKSCPSCRPTKFTWITVTLRCPNLSPPYRKKRIQKIRQCRCREE